MFLDLLVPLLHDILEGLNLDVFEVEVSLEFGQLLLIVQERDQLRLSLFFGLLQLPELLFESFPQPH